MRHRVLATLGVVGAIFLLLGCIAEAPVVREVALQETGTRGAKYTIDMRTEEAKTTYDKLGGSNIQPHYQFMHRPMDFNGDGKKDLVFRNSYDEMTNASGRIRMIYGNDRSSLRSQFNGTDPFDLKITQCDYLQTLDYTMDCDFDGDGSKDILYFGVLIDRNMEGSTFVGLNRTGYFMNVLFGGDDNSFSGTKDLESLEHVTFITNWTNSSISLSLPFTSGDFNGDGYDDIAYLFTRYEQGDYNLLMYYSEFRVIYGGPRGSYPRLNSIEQNDTSGIIVSSPKFDYPYDSNNLVQLGCTDFNGDGIDDLIVFSGLNFWIDGNTQQSGRVDIIYGSSLFAQENTTLYSRSNLSFYYPAGQLYLNFISKGDLNADGRMDLICDVRKGDSDETLVVFGSNRTGQSIDITKLDILILDSDIGTGNPYKFQNTEVFGPDIGNTYMSGEEMGDFNGDGADDIFIYIHRYPILVGQKYLLYPIYDYIQACFIILGPLKPTKSTLSVTDSAEFRILIDQDLFEGCLFYCAEIDGDGIDEILLYGYDSRNCAPGEDVQSLYILYPSSFLDKKFKASGNEASDTIILANTILCIVSTIVLTVPFIVIYIYKRRKKKETENRKKNRIKKKLD